MTAVAVFFLASAAFGLAAFDGAWSTRVERRLLFASGACGLACVISGAFLGG